MKALKKKGFTLVELLVVIALIGVLSAALTTQVPRIREMGRATRCKANLRNLAMAAQSWSLIERDTSRTYPAAGSWESSTINMDPSPHRVYWSGAGGHPDAWVSWTYGESDTWPWNNNNRQSWRGNMRISRFDGTGGYISVTNGCLWEYVGKDLSVYVCDAHKSVAVQNQVRNLVRSYVMNEYFGWDSDGHRNRKDVGAVSVSGTSSLRLMFAELPGGDGKESGRSGFEVSGSTVDSVLQYEDGEVIGFNHRAARKLAGHVAFADGHVETVVRPSKDSEDLRKLTKALCEAREVERDIRLRMQ